MQCNNNSFIQIINFHGLFRNALTCRIYIRQLGVKRALQKFKAVPVKIRKTICSTKSKAFTLFWFSTEHRQTALMPFWFSANYVIFPYEGNNVKYIFVILFLQQSLTLYVVIVLQFLCRSNRLEWKISHHHISKFP